MPFQVPDAFALSGNRGYSNVPTIPGKWVIDTGASEHMVCSASQLTTVINQIKASVKLPNGDSAQVIHIGMMKLSDTLTLTDVLVVPYFKFNLISASNLIIKHKCFLEFLHHYCFILNLLTWKTIGIGKLEGGLYHFQHSGHQLNGQSAIIPQKAKINSIISHNVISHVSSSKCHIVTSRLCCNNFNSATCNFVSKVDVHTDIDIWHCRLGHIPLSKMSLLHKIVPDITFDCIVMCVP